MPEVLRGRLSLEAHGSCVAVVMAGGSGTRFWPLSRNSFPKQFLPLGGEQRSLLQATVDRIQPLCGRHGAMIVTADHQAPLVGEQLPETAILSEPLAKNTAACIGYAAVAVAERLGDVPMICVPADHVIHGQEAILEVYRQAIAVATEHDVLVTIGIRPTLPETGYGYIEAEAFGPDGVAPVRSFVEKPDRATAEQYLLAGNYFWNSGMFVWRPSVILAAIERHLPALGALLKDMRKIFAAGADFEAVAELYSRIEAVSIDVGVMERAKNVRMLAGEGFMWSDVGSWSSWADVRRSGEREESVCVDGDALAIGCEQVTVVSKSRFVAAVGLREVIIVDTDDALLVCAKGESQRVKEVVEHLKGTKRENLL